MDDTTANPFYAFRQLEQAYRTASSHASAETRERARARIVQWNAVLSGMAEGQLSVGSRTPVADTPAWVTLEVTHGGFPTGRYLAEAPPHEDEQALLEALPPNAAGSTEREQLNLRYLSDAGLTDLRETLRAGTYRIEFPEEAALPAVAWLLDNGKPDLALDIITQIRPLLHRLRFTPRPHTSPVTAGAGVHVEPVGVISKHLAHAETNRRVATMRETLRVWHPLYDRLVALWCDTVDGPLPQLSDGRITGGWPARTWPSDWTSRRRQWLADYAAAMKAHLLSRAHTHPKSNFARLHSALSLCEQDSSALGPRDVGWVRRVLANTISKHGSPNSQPRAALRAAQAEAARQPTHAALARILADRLDRYPHDGGVAALDPVAQPVTGQESSEEVPAGTEIPHHLVGKVRRALEAPVTDLVKAGIITSGDVLARVLPQLTGQAIAAGFHDPSIASLYAQTYAAFRRRRSLLLLNLEHQVQFGELPWIAALDKVKTGSAGTSDSARHVLSHAVLLALDAFPHAILPNPLVREFSALAERAQLSLPFVEEIAADIFMGTFTEKWQQAAAITGEVMAGTLYARYFDLPDSVDRATGPRHRGNRERRRWGKRVADSFAASCAARAREAGHDGPASFVARQGAVLEQSQILTTHNLATLVEGLQLTERIRELAPELAERAFTWAVRRQSRPAPDQHAAHVMMKNVAYAWRQGIFFLSFCDEATQAGTVHNVRDQIANRPLPTRFDQVVAGLEHVLHGSRFTEHGYTELGGRRLLGWSIGPHWCLSASGMGT